MQSFGSYLKSEREKKGIRLEEIASITKIHLTSLELMEEDRWSDLPPEPFIRGFITAYAKYIGLNTKEALETFRKFNAPVVEEPVLSETAPPTPQSESHTSPALEIPEPPKPVSNADELSSNEATPMIRRSHILTGVGILAVGIVILLAWIGNKETQSPTSEPTAQVPGSTSETPIPTPEVSPSEITLSPSPTIENPIPSSEPSIAAQLNHLNASPTPSPVATPPPAAATAPVLSPKPSPTPKADSQATATPTPAAPDGPGHELVVIGKYRSWIKVVIDDAPPIEYFLGEGEKATYKALSKIKVVLGNSAGAEIFHNGELTPGVKFSGTIRSYIFPSNARFPQDKVKRAAPSASENDTQIKPEAPGQDE